MSFFLHAGVGELLAFAIRGVAPLRYARCWAISFNFFLVWELVYMFGWSIGVNCRL